MRKLTFILVVVLTGGLASCGRLGKTISSSGTEEVSPAFVMGARNFVDTMSRGHFLTAASKFDENMQAAMPPQALAQMWNGLVAQAGRYIEQTGTHSAIIQGFENVYVTCRFERTTTVTFRVVFNSDGEIGGLWIE